MRHINMDIVRFTEAAAIAASAWIGSGDKLAADKAATEAMRNRLNTVDFYAKIVIGEGIKDGSSGLFAGEFVGKASNDAKTYEIAVDPIEGTRPTVTSGPEALSVIAVAEQGGLFETGEFYMNKLACGPDIAAKAKISVTDPVSMTVQKVSQAIGKKTGQMVVCVLDRPRHAKLIAELRAVGVRIKLIQDCDVSGAIAAALPTSGIDLLLGTGGAPEGVLAACALKCLRGDFQAQLADKDGNIVDTKILRLDDLVKTSCAFAATGVTTGSLLQGVRYTSKSLITHSVFMRSESGTVRWIKTYHGN